MTQGILTRPPTGEVDGAFDRRLLTAALSVISVATALTGFGLVAAGVLILAVASALSDRRSLVSVVPPAAVLVGFMWMVALQLAALLEIRVLTSPWGARAAISGFALFVAALTLRRSGRVMVASRSEFWAILPALGLAAGVVVLSWLPAHISTVWFGGGIDNVNHTLHAVLRQQQGSLDYAQSVHPGGWHSIVALIMTASSDAVTPSPETLVGVLQLSGRAVWLLYGLVVLTLGLLAHDWASFDTKNKHLVGWAGAGAGVMALGPTFFGFTMYLGFQTFIAASLAVSVLVREATTDQDLWRWRIAAGSAAVALTAHSWPPALAFVVVPWLFLAWGSWRLRGLRGLPESRMALVVTAVTALSVLDLFLRLVPRTDTAARVGVEGAAIAELPMTWVAGGAAALTLLSLIQRRPLPVLLQVPGLAAAPALAVHGGVELLSYYPRKLLWIVALLGVPAIWSVCAYVLGRLVSVGAGAKLVRAVAAASLTAVATVGVAVPVLMIYQPERWASWARTLAVATQHDAGLAQVVWKVESSDEGDVFLARILDFYRIEDPQAVWPLRVLTIEEQCGVLLRAGHPAVLTTRAPNDVQARFTCEPDVLSISARP